MGDPRGAPVTGSARPGEAFREFAWTGPWVNAGNWQRVTDPQARHPGAAEFLPNPVNAVRLEGVAEALRAEVTLEQWGGHAGTSDKRLRLNGGDWIPVPEPEGIPGQAGPHPHPQCYQYFTYPTVALPLEQLREGDNTFELTCGGQTCFDFGWGQWGIYGASFRMFCEPSPSQARGRIVSPEPGARLGGAVEIGLEPRGEVAQVDYLGRYEDFDDGGSGAWRQWHHTYRHGVLQRHLGSARGPGRIEWGTDWVPDQNEPMAIAARVRGRDGVCSITEVVDGLVLARPDRAVHLCKPFAVPPRWQTRDGQRQGCRVRLPTAAASIEAARLVLATWSGGHADAIGIDRTPVVERVGLEHDYSLDEVEVPVELLHDGEMELYTEARTEHHGIEVLWPGICLKVREKRR
ncbi:MAG: hypothetical protein ABIL09_11240 [Gemmatimonadota bacterium]